MSYKFLQWWGIVLQFNKSVFSCSTDLNKTTASYWHYLALLYSLLELSFIDFSHSLKENPITITIAIFIVLSPFLLIPVNSNFSPPVLPHVMFYLGWVSFFKENIYGHFFSTVILPFTNIFQLIKP